MNERKKIFDIKSMYISKFLLDNKLLLKHILTQELYIWK